MTTLQQCQACGHTLDESVAGGQCIRCLMQLAMETPDEVNSEREAISDDDIVDLNGQLVDYEVLESIGRGGMGVVYKARCRHTGRMVAIKIPPRSIAEDRSLANRFLREGKTLAQLDHPYIVTAIDVGSFGDSPYLVMEYVDGTDLATRVNRSGPVGLRSAVQWIAQAAEALQCAHRQGIIHRDVKPANLLVDLENNLKILDLGLARLLQRDIETSDTELTQTGSIMGTVDFMSPEQGLDMRTADARSDIYSLGCTMYLLLTGNRMYAESTRMKTFLAHRENPIPDLQQARPDVPEKLDRLFRSMVAKSPADRPGAMSTVAEQLQQILHTLPEGDIDGVTVHTGAALVDTDVEPVTVVQKHAQIKRLPGRKWSITGFSLAGVVAVAMLSMLVYRLQTDFGTMVVKVDGAVEKEFDIRLSGGGIELVNLGSDHLTKLNPDQSTAVSSGIWQIKPIADLRISARRQSGEVVDTERFTIQRNDRIVVEVTMLPADPTVAVATTRTESPADIEAASSVANALHANGAFAPEAGPVKISPQHVTRPLIYSIEVIRLSVDQKTAWLSGTGGHAIVDLDQLIAGTKQQVRHHETPIHNACYSRDGTSLIGLLENDQKELSLALFDVETLEPTRVLGSASARNMAPTPDGSRVAYLSDTPRNLVVVDLSTGVEAARFDLPEPVDGDLRFSPGGSLLAASSGAGILVWDLATDKHSLLPTPRQRGIAFSEDRKTLVSVGHEGLVRRWELETSTQLNQFQIGSKTLSCIHLMKDARRALIGSFDGKCYLVDVTTGDVLAYLTDINRNKYSKSPQRVLSVAMTKDERYALTGTSEYRFRLWRIPSPANETR